MQKVHLLEEYKDCPELAFKSVLGLLKELIVTYISPLLCCHLFRPCSFWLKGLFVSGLEYFAMLFWRRVCQLCHFNKLHMLCCILPSVQFAFKGLTGKWELPKLQLCNISWAGKADICSSLTMPWIAARQCGCCFLSPSHTWFCSSEENLCSQVSEMGTFPK